MKNIGYQVDGTLPSVITAEQFDVLTGGVMSSSSERKAAVLTAVSSAVRDWCGWHVGPVCSCTFTGEGEGRTLVLPAMGVENVESLTVNGEAVDFEWKSDGLVRLKRRTFPDQWQSVVCEFTAGYDVDSIGAVIAQIAANQLTAAPGVLEEHAGNVGVTYNKSADGLAGGVRLNASDKELLAPYKLVRAW